MPAHEHAHDPAWILSFDGYVPDDEGRREVVLAQGNGIFLTRAAGCDAAQDGTHYPGTYHVACYDRVPNRIDGVHDEIESLVNLPNWLPVRFRIFDEEWLHPDDVETRDYRHRLDLRTGVATRTCTLVDHAGRRIRLHEQRLVSMDDPHLAAIRIELVPLGWSGKMEVCSLLDGKVRNANVRRFLDYEQHHLSGIRCEALGPNESLLQAHTTHSRIEVAIAMRSAIKGHAVSAMVHGEGEPHIDHRFHVAADDGQAIVVEKTVALCTSLDAAGAPPAQQAEEALRRAGGFDTLRADHERRWSELWDEVRMEADNAEIALPLHLHAFHILQTLSPHSAAIDTGIPARGWHGEGYQGHIFWDELFVLPFFMHRFPALAKIPLQYRYRRLDAARAAARMTGYRGAMYPWRSASDGREVTPRQQKNLITGTWMRDDTRLQRHIGSAIAFNIWQYWLASGDDAFLAGPGAEMLLEIARFWSGIARPYDRDRYEIRGVMGPDEYHSVSPGGERPGLDNNAYTNVMAVWTLCRAFDVLEQLPPERREALRTKLALQDEELSRWEDISRRMFIPFHDDGILSQFEGFERLEEFDPAILPPALADKRTDWALRAVGRQADEFKVTKQADALTLFYLLPEKDIAELFERLGYRFDRENIRRTAHYYLQRTMHRSSLSKIVYAGALAECDPEQSWQFYREALAIDLNPMQGEKVAEGVHLGAMGGTLDILQRRYLGLSPQRDGLAVFPALPAALGRVSMRLRYRGHALDVRTEGRQVRVASSSGNQAPLCLLTGEGRHMLEPGASVTTESR